MLQNIVLYVFLTFTSVAVVIAFIFILWVIVWKLFLRRFKFIQALTDSKQEESLDKGQQERASYGSRLRARRVQS